MEALFNPANINPTVFYVVLLAGLWIAITAAHVGGTGVLEIASLVVLGICVYVLTLMPTNWVAVLLMVLGSTSFMVLPYLSARYGHLAELGLLLQAVGGVLLFNDRSVSPLMVAATVVISWLYNRLVLMPILRTSQQRTELDNATDVIGARGRVTRTIDPVGSVYVNGETWTARSKQAITVDTEVIVRGKRGLELIVEKAKHAEEEPVD